MVDVLKRGCLVDDGILLGKVGDSPINFPEGQVILFGDDGKKHGVHHFIIIKLDNLFESLFLC